MEEDIIREFEEIVEDARQEYILDYYYKIRNVLKLLKKYQKENKELKEIISGKAIQEMGTSEIYEEE